MLFYEIFYLNINNKYLQICNYKYLVLYLGTAKKPPVFQKAVTNTKKDMFICEHQILYHFTLLGFKNYIQ